LGEKGTSTRERLLDATATLIQSTSVWDLRVAQIARLAKASPATFYVYFRDINDAVLAIAQATTQSPPDLLALLAESWEADAEARSAAFVRAYVNHWQANAAIFRMRNLASEEGDTDFYMTRWHAVMPLIELMAVRLRDRARSSGLDARALAGTLISMIEAISQFRTAPPSSTAPAQALSDVSVERMLRAATYFITLFVGGRPSVEAPPARTARRPAGKPAPAALAPAVDRTASLGEKGLRTRARLIEAATDLIASRSLRDLTMADIAKAAGISKATFYEYFSDASDVVLAAVAEDTDMRPLNAALGEALAAFGPSLGAHEFVKAYIDWSRDRSALIRVRNVAADEGDLRFLMSRIDAVRPILASVARAIEDRQAEGRLPASLHPPSTACCVLAMIERLAVTIAYNLVPGANGATTAEAGAHLLSILLGGEPLAFAETTYGEAEASAPL